MRVRLNQNASMLSGIFSPLYSFSELPGTFKGRN